MPRYAFAFDASQIQDVSNSKSGVQLLEPTYKYLSIYRSIYRSIVFTWHLAPVIVKCIPHAIFSYICLKSPEITQHEVGKRQITHVNL